MKVQMVFTDTHAHLYDEAFSGEEDQAVERAVAAGVTKMILPDIDSQTREAMFTLAGRHEEFFSLALACTRHP